MKEAKRIAVVIGAGSVKCAAAIGLMRVLEREKIPVDLLVGCSAGSIFTALTATGHGTDTAAELAGHLWTHDLTGHRERRALLRVLLPRLFGFDEHFGLRSDQPVMARLREVFGLRRLEDLPIPLRVTATDFHSGEQVIFREGNLIDVIRASIAIPFVFKPWEIAGRLCVDGFVSDPLPVNVALAEGAEIVLAMGFESPHHQEVRSPVRFAFQLSSIMTNNLMRSRYAMHHLANWAEVIPVMPEFGERVHLFDAAKIPHIIEAGERAAEAVLPALHEALAAPRVAAVGIAD